MDMNNPTTAEKNIIYNRYVSFCKQNGTSILSFKDVDSGKNGSWQSYAIALGIKPAAGLKLWGDSTTPTGGY